MTETAGAQAELDQLNYEIAVLEGRVEQARQAWAAIFATLGAAKARRDALLQFLATPGPAPATPGLRSAGSEATGATREGEASQAPGPARAERAPSGTGPGPARAERRAEASTRTVQNLLFILGGLLLGSAAIVFTAVAWTTFGVTGRAVILAVVTGLTLTVPPLVSRRRLVATAETFAALGLLLVALDGYAAWKVNLFGVTAIPTARYAAIVAVVTAAFAAAYHVATRLAAPAVTAVLVAQPVIPLLAVDLPPTRLGGAATYAGLALLNTGVLVWVGHRTGWLRPTLATIAWLGYAIGLAGALARAIELHLHPSTVADAAWASASALLVVVVLAAGAALLRASIAPAVVASVTAVIAAATASRFMSVAAPDHTLVLAAAAATAVVAIALAARPVAAATIRPGLAAGAAVTAGGLGVVLVVLTGVGLLETIGDALPPWRGDGSTDPTYDWQLLAALGLGIAAFAAAVPRPARLDAAILGAALAVLAVPASIPLRWWAPSAVYLGGAAIFGLAAVDPSRRRSLAGAGAAAVLTVGAVLTGLARPEQTAAILGGVVVLGAAIALAGRAADHRQAVRGSAGLVALLALPSAVWAALVAADAPMWWVARLTVAAIVAGPLATAAARRWRPGTAGYPFAATLVSAFVWPAVAAVASAEPLGVYGGAALILVATALLALTPSRVEWVAAPLTVAAMPGAAMLVVHTLPAVLAVVAAPYTWLGAVWSGAPAGVGLTPADVHLVVEVRAVHAVALGLVAIASAITAYAITRRLHAAVSGLGIGGPTAVLTACVATGAPWPTVAAVTLALGLLIVLIVAITGSAGARATIASAQALVYVGAGLSGLLTLEWSTLVGLGAVAVGFTAVGLVGRGQAWRIGGWTVAATATLAFAAAAGLAADLAARTAAFGVLAAAALCLLGGAALARFRPPPEPEPSVSEGHAVQAVGHVGAVMALLFATGSDRHAAAICTLWGIVVGVRAIWPGTGRTARAVLAAVAGGFELVAWWLLLADLDVALVEAYTLPLAAVALLAGFVAARGRPELNSWVAYGPALAAAFLPSLGTVFGVTAAGADGQPWRRLLLGVGAVLVVIGGSVRRRQAPVIVGGTVLSIVALHEIALLWDLLPRWIPLGVGGALLVTLAITYERRRRDMNRLRAAVGRMT
jgi:hypothetical protein